MADTRAVQDVVHIRYNTRGDLVVGYERHASGGDGVREGERVAGGTAVNAPADLGGRVGFGVVAG